jgi:8-oxo-dGTP diphosphatase
MRPDGCFLLAQRPLGKIYEGYWEFPGGKIEPGESPRAALDRELREELGIDVECAYPWITRRYTYTHATVDLHFFRVVGYRGEPHSRERQAFAWQRIDAISVAPILPANGPILAALGLPNVYAITNAAETGADEFLMRMQIALAVGIALIQVREPHMAKDRFERFSTTVLTHARAAGARVLINADLALARRLAADGVHLKASQLNMFDERPDIALVGASCHDARELALAARLGVDFVVLGPVAPTASHPGADVLGWPAFEALVRGFPVPVFALGGMRHEDLDIACRAGAHGLAMQRGAWP